MPKWTYFFLFLSLLSSLLTAKEPCPQLENPAEDIASSSLSEILPEGEVKKCLVQMNGRFSPEQDIRNKKPCACAGNQKTKIAEKALYEPNLKIVKETIDEVYAEAFRGEFLSTLSKTVAFDNYFQDDDGKVKEYDIARIRDCSTSQLAETLKSLPSLGCDTSRMEAMIKKTFSKILGPNVTSINLYDKLKEYSHSVVSNQPLSNNTCIGYKGYMEYSRKNISNKNNPEELEEFEDLVTANAGNTSINIGFGYDDVSGNSNKKFVPGMKEMVITLMKADKKGPGSEWGFSEDYFSLHLGDSFRPIPVIQKQEEVDPIWEYLKHNLARRKKIIAGLKQSTSEDEKNSLISNYLNRDDYIDMFKIQNDSCIEKFSAVVPSGKKATDTAIYKLFCNEPEMPTGKTLMGEVLPRLTKKIGDDAYPVMLAIINKSCTSRGGKFRPKRELYTVKKEGIEKIYDPTGRVVSPLEQFVTRGETSGYGKFNQMMCPDLFEGCNKNPEKEICYKSDMQITQLNTKLDEEFQRVFEMTNKSPEAIAALAQLKKSVIENPNYDKQNAEEDQTEIPYELFALYEHFPVQPNFVEESDRVIQLLKLRIAVKKGEENYQKVVHENPTELEKIKKKDAAKFFGVENVEVTKKPSIFSDYYGQSTEEDTRNLNTYYDTHLSGGKEPTTDRSGNVPNVGYQRRVVVPNTPLEDFPTESIPIPKETRTASTNEKETRFPTPNDNDSFQSDVPRAQVGTSPVVETSSVTNSVKTKPSVASKEIKNEVSQIQRYEESPQEDAIRERQKQIEKRMQEIDKIKTKSFESERDSLIQEKGEIERSIQAENIRQGDIRNKNYNAPPQQDYTRRISTPSPFRSASNNNPLAQFTPEQGFKRMATSRKLGQPTGEVSSNSFSNKKKKKGGVGRGPASGFSSLSPKARSVLNKLLEDSSTSDSDYELPYILPHSLLKSMGMSEVLNIFELYGKRFRTLEKLPSGEFRLRVYDVSVDGIALLKDKEREKILTIIEEILNGKRDNEKYISEFSSRIKIIKNVKVTKEEGKFLAQYVPGEKEILSNIYLIQKERTAKREN